MSLLYAYCMGLVRHCIITYDRKTGEILSLKFDGEPEPMLEKMIDALARLVTTFYIRHISDQKSEKDQD